MENAQRNGITNRKGNREWGDEFCLRYFRHSKGTNGLPVSNETDRPGSRAFLLAFRSRGKEASNQG